MMGDSGYNPYVGGGAFDYSPQRAAFVSPIKRPLIKQDNKNSIKIMKIDANQGNRFIILC